MKQKHTPLVIAVGITMIVGYLTAVIAFNAALIYLLWNLVAEDMFGAPHAPALTAVVVATVLTLMRMGSNYANQASK